jgi:hypothetical protein
MVSALWASAPIADSAGMVDPETNTGRRPALGEPVTTCTRAALENLRRAHPDERRAASLLQVSRSTYARALAGLGLRRGSIALIETRLRAMGMYEGRRP